ncbi:MAG: 4a-hydroxytetrahydrobiopterin dehydratase [Anaerolineae bacterium]|jgi:4a-hydroxytetrahydrobiopterin dehydratase|nr:4a-hydroxytetrahydrobiopterin dehydratase [Anaerolineae bacterium]MBT7073542.1 4a-hydroxytetrahydrobiopterin dehydratase [Anaerolineae bacterium]MBT7781614.1 4a-hydroxytetrahydrobiopterin dehydratase [Anaerolineae bacterium]
MIRPLIEFRCIPCRGDTPALSLDEIAQFLPQIPEWQLVEVEKVPRLERVFLFKNFADALRFANQVGEIAEAEDHHPLIMVEWGRVAVQWWTYAIGGLHKNDFIMAAKTDALDF